MTDNVITPDFGKDRREAVRIFAHLMGIAEATRKDILRNPEKYLDDASCKIVALRSGILAAQDALRAPVYEEDPVPRLRMETTVVPKDEYDRLLACARIVQELL